MEQMREDAEGCEMHFEEGRTTPLERNYVARTPTMKAAQSV